MYTIPKNARVAASVPFILVALLIAGCSSGTGMVPVSGKLTFAGRELPHTCRITFVPEASGPDLRPMGGEMHADGTYTITPFKGVSGLFPGTYVVRIAFYDLRPGGNPDSDAGFIERQYVVPEKLVIESGSRPVTYDVEVPAKPR